MKYTAAVTVALAAVATASPTMVIDKRQNAGAAPKGSTKGKSSGASSMNQYTDGGCKGTVMIFSRGTGEPGNVGFVIGPPLFRAVEKLLGGDVAFEGIKYPAEVTGNFGTRGASEAGIAEGTKLFKEIAQKCPQSAIVGGGYSQGAALQHRAVEGAPKDVQDHIAAVVLFGDTKNKQEGGKIKGFPAEKAKVYCNPSDGVCGGALNVNAGHLSYSASIQPAANWIVQRVQAWKKAKGIPDNSTPIPADAPTELVPPSGGSAKGSSGATPKASSSKGKGTSSPKNVAPPAAAPPAPAAAPMEGMEGMDGMEGMGGMAGMSHGMRRA